MLRHRQRCEAAIGNAPLHLAIENTGGWLPFQREGLDLLLESPTFALTWDAGHSAVSGMDEDFLRARITKLKHMHLHDCLGTQDHLTPGEGGVDIAERLRVARDRGCTVVVEGKTEDALARSAARLRDLIKREPCNRRD